MKTFRGTIIREGEGYTLEFPTNLKIGEYYYDIVLRDKKGDQVIMSGDLTVIKPKKKNESLNEIHIS